MNDVDIELVLPRVRALVEVGRWQQALDALAPGTASSQEAYEVHALRAQCQLALDRPRAALESATLARREAPDVEWPHRLVSIAASHLGRTRLALEAAQEAARLSPHGLQALSVLAGAQLDRGEVAGADRTSAALLEEHPQEAASHRTAGAVAMARRDWHAAEEHLRTALRIDPQDPEAQLELAAVLEAAGRGRDAQQLRVAAVQAAPQSPAGRSALAGGLGSAAAGGLLLKVLAATQFGRALAHLSRPFVLTGLFGVVLVAWLLHARQRRRAGRDLPQGFWEGLEDERRREDLAYLTGAGLLLVVVGVVDAFRWAYALTSGAVVVGELAAGAVVVVGARVLRRRTTAAAPADDRRPSDVARLVLARLRPAGRGRGAVWTSRQVWVVGRPTFPERFPYGVATFWLTALLLVVAAACGPRLGPVLVVLVLLYPPLRFERRPVHTRGGAALRLVVRAGTDELLPAGRRVVRHLLRLLLAPVVLLEHLSARRRPLRCLHDRLTGAEVVLVSSRPPTTTDGARLV